MRSRKKNKSGQKKKLRIRNKVGKAPGTITYMGYREGTSTVLTVLEYNDKKYESGTISAPEEISGHIKADTIAWFNVVGLSDELLIEKIGETLQLNPLVLEDIVNTRPRPKIDEYDDYIFGVFTMSYLDTDQKLIGEHVALVLYENAVVVFQELEQDVFNGIRERIENHTGRVRAKRADYLFFLLLDAIIDNYYVVLEHIGDRIEVLETEVYERPNPETAHKIQDLKKDVLNIRRWIFPVRELVSRLIETDHKLISADTRHFLRDAMDHSIEINESLQVYREMTMSLMEMYISNVSNKMNEVMKVLTIMASIFIPLTFIAGIYGMNFDHMPELHWPNGYFYALGLMLLIFILMLIYFKRKRWL